MEFARLNHNDKRISDMASTISGKFTKTVYVYLDNETNSYKVFSTRRNMCGRFRYVGSYNAQSKRKVSDLKEILKNFEGTVHWQMSSYIGLKRDMDIAREQCVFRRYGNDHTSMNGWAIDLDMLLYKSEEYRNIMNIKLNEQFERELCSQQVDDAIEDFINELN